MEPRIQYAQTEDGVSIAFWTLGEGEPLVLLPAIPFSHIQLEWQRPGVREFYQILAKRRMIVRYDARGTGLSTRTVADFSLDAHVDDLKAVADRLELESFALWGEAFAGLVAVAYSAQHSERVSHLLLWCSCVNGSDFWRSPRAQAFRSIRGTDWELYTASMAEFGWGMKADQEEARRLTAFIRECVTQDDLQAILGALEEADNTARLAQVRSSTLVLHRREVTFPGLDCARELVSLIPDCRLVLLEGTSIAVQEGDTTAVIDAIEEFLGESEEAGAEPRDAGAFRTVLFTDVEGSTALTQRLGDAKARDLLREHERMVREALKSHGGSEVKTMGDGFMASFSSATKALECAIAMQRSFAAHNENAEEPIKVRVGLNAGEPIAEDDDLFGTAVNEAARITAAAKGGEILVANVVRELAKGKDFLFADRGETSLRGFEDPVRLFEVRWQKDA